MVSPHTAASVFNSVYPCAAAQVLHDVLHTPAPSTLNRTVAAHRISLRYGRNAEVFSEINALYERQLSRRGVRRGTVCVVFAEDETAVTASIEDTEPDLDKREVILIGFCGPLCGEVGPDGQPGPHKCGLSGVKFSATGTCQMADLRRIFEQHRVGHYVSVVLIVPLCHDLPVVACHLEVTCNRFTSADIDEKWDWLSEQYYNAGLGETLGPLLGHASDGDVRRRGAQLRRSLRCTAPLDAELYSGVDGLDICVTLSEVNGKQRPSHLSVQDYIHGFKKFFNCFRDTKDLALGVHSISMAALVETVERVGVEVHGIRAGDVAADRNRQNTRPILRMVSPDALAAIETLPDFEERHRGTHAFLSLISDFIDVFENDSMSWVDRIDRASYVVHFLRYWRAWVVASPGYTLAKNFVTPEALLDAEIACAAFVNLVGLWKDFELSDVPPDVKKMASEACEVLFSRVGGWVLNKHVQTALGFLRCVENQMALSVMEGRVEGLSPDAFAPHRRRATRGSGSSLGTVADMPDRPARNDAYKKGQQRALETVRKLIRGPGTSLPSVGVDASFVLDHSLHGKLTVPVSYVRVADQVTFKISTGDDLEQIDLSDMEVDCDIDREAQYVGETGGGGSSGAGSAAGASAGSSSHGDGGAVAGSDSGVAGRIVGVLDGCGISTAASSGAVEDDSETLPERVVLGVAAPGLGCSDGLTMDSIAAVLSDSPGIPRAALAALGIALSADPAEELAGAGVPNSVGAASGAASRRARRLGLMMDVEQGEGKASKSMHVSSVISMLNCIPSASTDRMLRIIEAAKAQVKEEDTGVKKTVGVGLTRGSLCAVLFDNDGTGDDPSTVWYGFVRRYGVRAGTRFKEWMKPVDFDDDTVDEKLVLQFTWLAPADRKHWGRTPGVPTYAFKSFGASGSQEGKKRGLCVQLAHVRVQDVTIRFDDGDGSCGCFVVTVPIACVIGVVKYDRVSSGKGSIPKLFRIDPADADVVESAARGIVLQRGLQAAGKAGSGTGSKKKPKNKATGQVKRSTKAGAGGAGAAVGSTDVGTEGDGGGGITGLLKHIRLRACPRTGLRSTVTQFTVGK